jgi:hypothetical protein
MSANFFAALDRALLQMEGTDIAAQACIAVVAFCKDAACV